MSRALRRIMLNGLIEMVTGSDNKSGGKIKLSMKCSGVKLDYEYDGPKRFSDGDKVKEKGTFELENFEIEGECEATMSGFFKLMGEMKDALTSSDASVRTFTDKLNIAAFNEALEDGSQTCVTTADGCIYYKVNPIGMVRHLVNDRVMASNYSNGRVVAIIKCKATFDTEDAISLFCQSDKPDDGILAAVGFTGTPEELRSRCFKRYQEFDNGYKYIIMGIR